MDYDGRFIMQKTVDWSLLNDGMTIPVSACALLKAWDESILTHGAGKDIKAAIMREQSEACFDYALREGGSRRQLASTLPSVKKVNEVKMAWRWFVDGS